MISATPAAATTRIGFPCTLIGTSQTDRLETSLKPFREVA